MGSWEQNKKLYYGLLAAAVVLLVLWPSFKEGRPAVISFYKPQYRKLEQTEKENAGEIRKYYNRRNRKMSTVISQARQFNGELLKQYRKLRNHVIFIPPMPYKIADFEPQPGSTLINIQDKAHTVDLLLYASLRDVEIVDKFLGINLGGTPPEDPDKRALLLRQLAMIDDLVRKATDCGVRSIKKVFRIKPIEAGPLNRGHFLKVYPVRMEIGASVESIMKFVNSLDGYHGKVTALGESGQEGGKLVRIDVGRDDGLTTDHAITFTIFDEVPDKQDGLRYKGRAYVEDIYKDYCTAIIPKDALHPAYKNDPSKRKIVAGDLATTNFYTLIDLRIRATPSREKNSLENDITATVTVGAVGLLDTAEVPIGSDDKPVRRTGPPRRTWTGGY